MNEQLLLIAEMANVFPSHLILLENSTEDEAYELCVHRGDAKQKWTISEREAFTYFSEIPIEARCKKVTSR